MKTNFSEKVCGRSLSIMVLALAGVSCALGLASVADCQEVFPATNGPPSYQNPSGCPVPIRLPTVPVHEPRPGEGAGPDQQWQTRREPGQAPTASLIESLRGNDAILEIVLGQGRLLTLKADLVGGRGRPVIAVGDPSVFEFDVLPNPRLLRLTGLRPGITDLSITTGDNQTYSFEVHVVYDLALLRTHLRQLFPDTQLRLSQMNEHLLVEGEARSIRQIDQILKTIEAYMSSVQVKAVMAGGQGGQGKKPAPGRRQKATQTGEGDEPPNASEDEKPTDGNGTGKSGEMEAIVEGLATWRICSASFRTLISSY
ncbi:MAG: pilus assembly protein N-terminal domain-containing protein [Planctomycetota bacterium]|nr:pilus assembly protein N-terminal domain-containing protein [Planctomycetota bacterium]